VVKAKATGISLISEKPAESEEAQSVLGTWEIRIQENNVLACEMNGILLKNVTNARTLSISKNRIQSCKSHGISVISSWPLDQSTSNGALKLEENCVGSCKGSGIQITDSFCQVLNCECKGNCESGIFVRGAKALPAGPSESTLSISHTTALENTGNGITLLENGKVQVLLEGCTMKGNKGYGLFTDCQVLPTISGEKSNRTPTPNAGGRESVYEQVDVTLKEGEVRGNAQGGIYVGAVKLSICETVVKENVGCAIMYDGTKGNVSYSSKSLNHKLIEGDVKNRSLIVNIYLQAKGKPECCSNCTII
jgi:hypothetical protein